MTAGNQELKAVLDEQIRCAEALCEALAREQQALLGANLDELGAASASKATLVTTLEGLETRRVALAAAAGAATSLESARLKELVAECKRRNDKNGALLNARTANARAALETLRGDQPAVYGRKGGPAPIRHDARPLGTA